MKIKTKLNLVAIAVAMSFLGTFLYTDYIVKKISKFEHLKRSCFSMEFDVLELRKHEKDFLVRKDLKYLENFKKTFSKILKKLKHEKELFISEGMEFSEISEFEKVVRSYKDIFIKIVNLQKKIGFNYKDGLYGSLRSSAYKVQENTKSLNDNNLYAKILTLRKHEKDFMLRMDMKYIDKFSNVYADTEQYVNNLVDNDNLLANLKEYKKDFLQLVKAEKEKGITSNSGLMKEMRTIIHENEIIMGYLIKSLTVYSKKIISSLEELAFFAEIFILIFILLIVLFTSRRIGKSLTNIELTSKDLAEGKGDLTQKLNIQGNDEIARVSQYINRFIEKVQITVKEAKSASAENSSISEELSQTSLQIGYKVEEEAKVVQDATKKGKELQEVLNRSIVEAKETKEEVTKTGKKLQNAKSKIAELSHGVHASSVAEVEMAQKLQQLNADAEQVKGVLTVISDIADQTNLLALNAAIEAARAGEHGRGFAVVADEVRTLAERTQKSLAEINATINVIVQSISDTTEQINLNSKKASQLAQNSTEVENDIDESVDNMQHAISDIEKIINGYVNNADATNIIITEVEKLNHLSSENARSVEEIASAVEHMSQMSVKLTDLLVKYKT